MSKLSITLAIAGKKYPLTIDQEREEEYRQAEREVNLRFSQIKEARFEGFQDKDNLALAALQISLDYIKSRVSRSLDDGDIERLKKLDGRLDDCLNRLD